MDIFEELTRIRNRGFNIVIDWDRSISFNSIRPQTSIRQRRKDKESFDKTIYQAILRFDEKYPEK